MKTILLTIALPVLLLAGCTKGDYIPVETDVNHWMRTHDRGVVAYVDYQTGNYIVETSQGYSVVELLSGVPPVEYDDEYAYFNARGIQTIYNRDGRYFSRGRVVDSWLGWGDALYVLDELGRWRY